MCQPGQVEVILPPDTTGLQCDWQDLTAEELGLNFPCGGEFVESVARILPSLGTTTSIIGGIQAMHTIKIIHGFKFFRKRKKWPQEIRGLANRLLCYDGEKYTLQMVKTTINRRCEIHNLARR